MRLTNAQKAKLRTAIIHLREHGPHDESFGICYNLDHRIVQGGEFIDTYSVVGYIGGQWPARTGTVDGDGRSAYPIAREFVGEKPWQQRVPLWQGTQLAQRHALLDYLLEQLA